MRRVILKETSFFVLASLTSGKRHGYGILKDVQVLSEGSVHLSVTGLYSALDKLNADGLIQPAGTEIVDGRLRHYFSLTDKGVNELSVETGRLERTAEQARALLRRRASRIAIASGEAS